MERRGPRPAAPDRRRDDLAPAHGGADRARLRPADASTCSTPRASSASSPTCSTRAARAELDDGEPRRAGAAARAARREGAPAAPAARGWRARTASGSPDDDVAAPSFTGVRVVEPDLGRAARVHRLAVLLPRLGAQGQASRDPRAARPRASSTRMRPQLLDELVRGRLAAGARRLRLLAGAGRRRRRRPRGRNVRFPMLRQQAAWGDSRPNRSPRGLRRAGGEGELPDHVGAFAVGDPRRRGELADRYDADARRLPRDHGQGARRPARRGVRRVPAPAGAAGLVRAGRQRPRPRIWSRSAIAASGRRSAIRPAPTTRRSGACSSCSARTPRGSR